MSKKLIGLMACAAMLGAGSALANDDHMGIHKDKSDISGSTMKPEGTQDLGVKSSTGSSTGSSGIGGAGSMDQPGAMGKPDTMIHDQLGGKDQMGAKDQLGARDTLANNELSGRVVRSDAKTLYVDHMGIIVPLQIDKQTKFPDMDLKSARDIKAGQDIRASFTVKNQTQNVATTIHQNESGKGGSGLMDLGVDQSGVKSQEQGTGGALDQGILHQRGAPDINRGSIDNRTTNPGPLNDTTQGTSPSKDY